MLFNAVIIENNDRLSFYYIILQLKIANAAKITSVSNSVHRRVRGCLLLLKLLSLDPTSHTHA